MILILEHCCGEAKAYDQKNWLEVWCHHMGWSIVLQVDTAQMGKCCDPLESGMSTYMYSSGCHLIWYNTLIWNIYDGKQSTRIALIKLCKRSGQSLGQQICCKVLFTLIQSVRPRSETWMPWLHWYKGRMYNRNHHQVLVLQSLHMHMI